MRVTGDKELVAALKVLGRGLPNSAVDRSMKNAAAPMLKDAVARARKHRQPGRRPKGGHLDEGLVFRRRKESTRHFRRFVIGATNRARKIAHLVEHGTAPHWQPRRFGGIMHPGARPFPFMRPAYDSHAHDITELFGRDIWKQFERLIFTLNRGGRRR